MSKRMTSYQESPQYERSQTIQPDVPGRAPPRLPAQDGLNEDEIATRFEAWLTDLDTQPTVELSVSASDELRRAYAHGDS